jgi:hypothetical protein
MCAPVSACRAFADRALALDTWWKRFGFLT